MKFRLPAAHLLCCPVLTGCGPELVHGPGFEDPWVKECR